MPTSTYRNLIDEICHMCLLPDPHKLYDHTALSIHGIDISIVERHDTTSEVIIHCDLGPLPTHLREAALHRLLEINFYLIATAEKSTFAINPKTGRATLAAAMPLQHIRAEQLLELLGQLADMANAWRRTFFLSPMSV